jgi:hypothetical protein
LLRSDLWIDHVKKYITVDEKLLAEPVPLQEGVQGMIKAEPKRLRRDTADGQPIQVLVLARRFFVFPTTIQQPSHGDTAVVLWGSDLTCKTNKTKQTKGSRSCFGCSKYCS